ncbi:hypothetical protein [Citromicrobium sp. JLT1363]|uniref:hypothetical protein n=1 Tax=Citromicrobium sp. JLT1363 TaxID=517722 RepID=UPI000225E929|nr:hypothetical protein [Citromicrobium sp. JLT1363]
MIKLTHVERSGPRCLSLAFSDCSHGEWSAKDLLTTQTVLTKPLSDRAFFERAFISFGALGCPNGLELSAESLHRKLVDADRLSSAEAT